MKIKILLILFLIVGVIFMAYLQGRSTKNAGHVWKLDWYDDFRGSEIDSDKWAPQVGGKSIFGSSYSMYYTNRINDTENANAYIEDNKLVIEAREEAYYPDHTWTSAMIRTKDLKSFGAGTKLEIMAKLAGTQGIFPAFWLSSQDEPYSTRQLNGEIDMMEFLGHDTDKIYSGVWAYYVDDLSSYTSPDDFESEYYVSQSGNSIKTWIDFTNEYHTFCMEWYSNKIIFGVDGKTHYTLNFSDYQFGDLYEPLQYDFYLRMNVAVGGTWAGDPDETTVSPSKMYIDWVKLYTQAEG